MFSAAISTLLSFSLLAPVPYDREHYTEELTCLTEILYFEARGESLKGIRAVANVVINRRNSKYFPNTVCGVRNQRNQFSFFFDGLAETIVLQNAQQQRRYLEILEIATLALNARLPDVSGNADHFYGHDHVEPDWAKEVKSSVTIGNHTFVKVY